MSSSEEKTQVFPMPSRQFFIPSQGHWQFRALWLHLGFLCSLRHHLLWETTLRSAPEGVSRVAEHQSTGATARKLSLSAVHPELWVREQALCLAAEMWRSGQHIGNKSSQLIIILSDLSPLTKTLKHTVHFKCGCHIRCWLVDHLPSSRISK